MMPAELPTPRPGLRLVNGSNSVAKLDVRVLPGEEAELPEGALTDADRTAMRPSAPAKPTKKSPAKKDTKS